MFTKSTKRTHKSLYSLFRDNQKTGLLTTEEISDIQKAKLEGLFEDESPTDYTQALAHAIWDVPYKTLAKTPMKRCSSIVSVKTAAESEKKPEMPKLQCENSRILDGPDLTKDYYHNPLCWGDRIYIALGSMLYAYNPDIQQIDQINSATIEDSEIRAVVYNNQYLLNINSQYSPLLIDTTVDQVVSKITCEKSYLFAASDGHHSYYFMDKYSDEFSVYDDRSEKPYGIKYLNKAPVISLNINFSSNTLAVNTERKIQLYDLRRMEKPKLAFNGHCSPGKALAFLPDERHIISGGGKSDKKIKIWNTQTGELKSELDTGAQICGIKVLNENSFFVHRGFQDEENPSDTVSCLRLKQNQLIKEAGITITEPDDRILFSAQNPKDPAKLITGSNQENLHFWSIKNLAINIKKKEKPESVLDGPVIR